MLDKNFWKKINEAQSDYENSRRIIISQANDALHKSKQAIFSLHRDNLEEAKMKIDEAQKILKNLQKDFGKESKLRYEGSWIAAMEEFVEANLFFMFIANSQVGEIADLSIESNEYLGGFADYTGELLRRAVLLSIKRQFDAVEKIFEEINEAVNLLLEYNLTGQLRTKFDQAKRNLNKIEQILYEINLKK